MLLQSDLLHLLVRDFNSLWVLFVVAGGADFQAGCGFGGANEIQHSFVVEQGLSSPVVADEGKHPVFNGIPLGGAGRIMADLDLNTEAVAEGELQLMFPQADSIAIASAAIGKDKQAIGIGIVS